MPIDFLPLLSLLVLSFSSCFTRVLLGIGFYTIQYKISTRGRRGGNRFILSLACEGKRGYRVSDPDDIGTVRLVGWLMMVSCPNSTYSFLCGSRLVCELGPVSIPKAHGAVRDRQWRGRTIRGARQGNGEKGRLELTSEYLLPVASINLWLVGSY